MQYKALAIDLDGTLLVGEDLPPDNIAALRAARDAGFKIIIASVQLGLPGYSRWRSG